MRKFQSDQILININETGARKALDCDVGDSWQGRPMCEAHAGSPCANVRVYDEVFVDWMVWCSAFVIADQWRVVKLGTVGMSPGMVCSMLNMLQSMVCTACFPAWCILKVLKIRVPLAFLANI